MKDKIKTLAYVIKRRNQGEASRVITLLTKDDGLVDVLARGIRKTNHRYAGLMQPFNLVGVVLRPTAIYHILEESTLVKPFSMLDEQLRGIGLGNVMLEVIYQACRDDESGRFFDLMNDYLTVYAVYFNELKKRENLLIFISSFILSVLAVAGRMPIVDGCWICGRERGDDWQATVGGFSHRNCGGDARVCCQIAKDTVKCMRLVGSLSCAELLKKDWQDRSAREILMVVLFWYQNFYERKMKSISFLDEIYQKIVSDSR